MFRCVCGGAFVQVQVDLSKAETGADRSAHFHQCVIYKHNDYTTTARCALSPACHQSLPVAPVLPPSSSSSSCSDISNSSGSRVSSYLCSVICCSCFVFL
jgi:hypothetical protein